MRFQFYPWTHAEVAAEIREKLGLPVDTPRKIEAGTMQRFWNWAEHPLVRKPTTLKIDRLLAQFEKGRAARQTDEIL